MNRQTERDRERETERERETDRQTDRGIERPHHLRLRSCCITNSVRSSCRWRRTETEVRRQRRQVLAVDRRRHRPATRCCHGELHVAVCPPSPCYLATGHAGL